MRLGNALGVMGVVVSGIATVMIFLLLAWKLPTKIDDLEFPLLVLPLLCAAAIVVLIILDEVVGAARSRLVRAAAWGVVTVGFVWAGLVAFLYDYPHYRGLRLANDAYAGALLDAIPDDVAFFAGHDFYAASVRLKEKDRVRLLYPARDYFHDFPKLVESFLAKGIRVFGVFHDPVWDRLKSGPLGNHTITPVVTFPGFFVAEISHSHELEGTR